MQTKGSLPSPLAALLLFAAACAVYLPALGNGFVWDDTALILRDPFIRDWRAADDGLRAFLFTDATASSFYRPLQRLSYTLDHALVGFAPAWYHASSILCHAAGAVGLLFFLTAWTGKPGAALFAAFAWALLPVHSAAVVYVAGRADPLAGLFGFWGLFAATRGRWPLAGLLLFLSALSKEQGLLFLPLLPLFGVSPRGWPDRAVWAGLSVALALGVALLRSGAEGPRPPEPAPEPSAVRAVVAARAVAEYAGLLAAPVNLRMERDVVAEARPREVGEALYAARRLRELQGALGVLLLAGGIAWFARAGGETRLALAAAALVYLPVSGLFPLNAHVAEHWLYIPSAFLLAAICLSLPSPAPLVPWMLFSACLTFLRCGDWRDQRTFLERTIASGGDSARMLLNLGSLESGEGNHGRAFALYAAARARAPELRFVDLAEAGALLRAGRTEEARAAYLRAGRDPFLRPQAFDGLASVFARTGERDPLDALETSSRLSGRAWGIEKRRAALLAETGEVGRAREVLEGVLRREPWRAEAREMLEGAGR